jgi:hypothetical protein
VGRSKVAGALCRGRTTKIEGDQGEAALDGGGGGLGGGREIRRWWRIGHPVELASPCMRAWFSMGDLVSPWSAKEKTTSPTAGAPTKEEWIAFIVRLRCVRRARRFVTAAIVRIWENIFIRTN